MSIRVLRLTAVATLLLGLLSGCWPLQQDAATAPASGSATLQAAGTPTAGVATAAGTGLARLPVSPDALNIAGQAGDPPSLDPALATDAYSLFVIRQLFSGLVAFDSDLKVTPDLATGLPSVSADGLTYTFALRQGVKFSDGQEVTARDFKYSFERATDPKLAGSRPVSELPASLFLGDIVGVSGKLAGKASDIAGIKAVDPYRLQITIDAPKAYFLSKLAAGPAFVVEQSNVEEGANWTSHPRGTGPFKLEKWVRNQQMVLAANADYYGGKPSLARVNIWMGSNTTGALQQYEAGGLDVANVPTGDIERVTDRNNPLSQELQAVPELAVTYIGLNLRQKPFDDPKIRQAFALAIDRQKLARLMFQSRVLQASGFVAPNMAGYTAPPPGEGLDITRARQLIADSTYKDVKNLPPVRLYTSGEALGPVLQDVFSRTLGIQIEVHETEWSDFLEGLNRRDYPMFTLTSSPDYPDPEAILGNLFSSTSPDNRFGYRNPDVDAALTASATESNQQKRMTTYAHIEQRVLGDAPAIPLYRAVNYTLVKPYVLGLKVTPLGILTLKNIRLSAR